MVITIVRYLRIFEKCLMEKFILREAFYMRVKQSNSRGFERLERRHSFGFHYLFLLQSCARNGFYGAL